MRLWTKALPEICLHKRVVEYDAEHGKGSYMVEYFYPFATCKKLVDLFEANGMVDFDDRLFGSADFSDGTQVDFLTDLVASEVLARYEDELYGKGKNFKTFTEYIGKLSTLGDVEIDVEVYNYNFWRLSKGLTS